MSDTCTWIGKKSFSWSEGENWDSHAPGEDDDLVVPGGSTFSSPVVPAGTRVRRATVSAGGGLQGRLIVREIFTWQGGSLFDGIELAGARALIAGNGGQVLSANLEFPKSAELVSARVDVANGARLVGLADVGVTGESRIVWASGANCVLDSRALLDIGGLLPGTLVLVDVVGLLRGTVGLGAGSALVVESRTVPTYLWDGARVIGTGSIRVTNGGRLYAAGTARVEKQATVELSAGGSIEDQRVARAYPNVVGAVPGKQGLTIGGGLLWTGGTLRGDVLIEAAGVLDATGPGPLGHESGLLRLRGNGGILGPVDYVTDTGELRNDGMLVITGPVRVQEGKGWQLDNRGTLRFLGPEPVRLGNNVLRNRGRIEVNEGTLQLAIQTDRVIQDPTGVLHVAAGAEVRAGGPLRLAGTVTGAGGIIGGLEVQGTLEPGTPTTVGRLNVDGPLRLGPRSHTRIRIEGTGSRSEVRVTGPVALDGELVVAAGHVPADGQVLDILASDTPDGLTGRFGRATLPAPVNGRFLRVHYASQAVRLVPSTNHTGLDAEKYPGDAVLREVVQLKGYRWFGYYLHTPPFHTDASWLGHRAFLAEDLGRGLAILYVGRQDPADGLNAPNGSQDAQDAVNKAAAEGFPAGSWVYLDVEWKPGPISAERMEYILAWTVEMLRIGTYSPAIYCPSQDVAALSPGLVRAYRDAQRHDRPRFWVAANSRPLDPALPPARSGTPEAIAWQQEFRKGTIEYRAPGDPFRTPDGKPWNVDRDVAVLPDPSAA